MHINCFRDWDNFADIAKQHLKKHFGVSTLASFGIEEQPLSQQTAAVLLGYLEQTQKAPIHHIKKILTTTNQRHMQLDRSTMLNLELFSTIREHDTNGSLLKVLDETITAMGGRMLKQWLRKPLISPDEVIRRHDAVEKLLLQTHLRRDLRDGLKEITDIERILSRLSVNIGNARDLVNLQLSLQHINGERFITPELKHHEEIILSAEEQINTLEYQLFQDVLHQVLSYTEQLQRAAQSIGILDCLLNFAHIAEKNSYVRPKLLYSGEIRIKRGRHPVVETLLEDHQFVPNDVTLDNVSQQLLLITGPNMAGKSVLIRQVALIVLLCQIGSFVPAEQAHLSIVDRIFVRSGASDVITSGLSTFMVEMVETAHILHYATKQSLIIMDEIGRGTSTYDGISIAWAVAEYLATHFTTPPKTLFATHYHELQALEKDHSKKIKNFHMAVVNDKGDPVFLHTILPGGASHSFGVAVAKLAGVPEDVIKKAETMLHNLEKRNIEKQETFFPSTNYSLPPTNLLDHLMQKDLEQIDISEMTPLEALNKLAELKSKLKLYTTQTEQLIGDTLL